MVSALVLATARPLPLLPVVRVTGAPAAAAVEAVVAAALICAPYHPPTANDSDATSGAADGPMRDATLRAVRKHSSERNCSADGAGALGAAVRAASWCWRWYTPLSCESVWVSSIHSPLRVRRSSAVSSSASALLTAVPSVVVVVDDAFEPDGGVDANSADASA